MGGMPLHQVWTEERLIAGDIMPRSSTGEANARLIAAAPEMLEALEELYSRLKFREPEIAEIAEEAIAKAEGRPTDQEIWEAVDGWDVSNPPKED
jgi:hypothetical protein